MNYNTEELKTIYAGLKKISGLFAVLTVWCVSEVKTKECRQ